jgi:hypothetical protein
MLIALAAVPVLADDVYLRGGGRMTGEIVAQTDDAVTVDIGGGTLTAKMSSVVRIEKSTSPLQQYRARAASVPAGDAEAWRALARWAQGWTLSTQAAEAYSKVLAILPDDAEANRALGRVPLDGRWVTEEESYRAQGYVEFEGEWMRPGERQAILRERQTQEEAARKENQAQIQAIQAEMDAEKAREAAQAERKARKFDHLPEYGDPIYWGWGFVPTTWPQNPASSPPGVQP